MLVASSRLVRTACVLAATVLIANAARAAPVKLALHLVGATTEPVKVELIVESVTTSGTDPVEIRIPATAPGEARLDLTPGTWLIHVQSPDHWGRSVLVTVTEKEQQGALRLWPTGTLQGRLATVDPGDRLPERFLLQFNPAPQKGGTPAIDLEGETVCEVADGAWSCSLPAGRPLDIQLKAAPFMPHYFWAIDVPQEGSLAMGALELRRGAAVAGWVLSEDPSIAVEGARLRLTPRAATGKQSEEDRERMAAMSATTVANDRGFFSLQGIPPGDYVIEASQEPLAPALASVRVLPGQLVEIDDPPLLLAPRGTLEIYIDPPVTPDGSPWRVELGQIDRGSSLLRPVETATAAVDGSMTRKQLPPGNYFLRIADHKGAYWLSEEIQLVAGEPTAPLFIDLPLIEARGRVLLGDEPLAAKLWFGGAHGFESMSTESDDEGAFRVLLPRSGAWSIEIESQKPRVKQELRSVGIEKRPGKPYAELELKLPATRVHGTVVDEEGVLVPGALIHVLTGSVDHLRDRSDSTGGFELWGLPPGITRLLAEKGRGAETLYSEEIEVDIDEDLESPPQRLVLRRERKIRGRIVTESGSSLAGARIKVESALTLGAPISSSMSDVNGDFSLGIPDSITRIFFSVSPPGFAFRMLAFELDSLPDPLIIPVASAAGTLTIELPEGFGLAGQNGPALIVRHGTALEHLAILKSWSAFNGVQQEGQTLHVPFMEPGEYSACLVPITERLSVLAGTATSCASGFLGATGELTLRPRSDDAFYFDGKL